MITPVGGNAIQTVQSTDAKKVITVRVIASAGRIAVGSFNGAFANTPAHELGAAVIKAVLERAGVGIADRARAGNAASGDAADVASMRGKWAR
nr:hypothetical protein [Mesorhizobium caraganae]